MGYNQSSFKNIELHCKNIFGKDRGNFIYLESEKKLSELLEEMDDRGSKAVRNHMTKNMLPVIAYYLTLKNNGFSNEEAYEKTLDLSQNMAKEKAETYKKLTRLPFVYLIFKLACKKMMSQSYPKEG